MYIMHEKTIAYENTNEIFYRNEWPKATESGDRNENLNKKTTTTTSTKKRANLTIVLMVVHK